MKNQSMQNLNAVFATAKVGTSLTHPNPGVGNMRLASYIRLSRSKIAALQFQKYIILLLRYIKKY